MNNKGDCRTALATPGLLTIGEVALLRWGDYCLGLKSVLVFQVGQVQKFTSETLGPQNPPVFNHLDFASLSKTIKKILNMI